MASPPGCSAARRSIGSAASSSSRHLPTASATHLLVKLVFAAPASFFSAADVLHDVCASRWHLPMKLVSAAPASRFSAACSLQDAASALVAYKGRVRTRMIRIIGGRSRLEPCFLRAPHSPGSHSFGSHSFKLRMYGGCRIKALALPESWTLAQLQLGHTARARCGWTDNPFQP